MITNLEIIYLCKKIFKSEQHKLQFFRTKLHPQRF